MTLNGDEVGADAPADPARVAVRNVGGIDECEVTCRPGVTVLSGQNATNRTSLLTALVGVLGGEMATLKSDADEGEVTLSLGDRTYTRSYERRGNAVLTSGDPLCDDPETVDLFAGLLERNAVRRGVERGDDLRDVLMRPVDTERINRRIRELESEREEVDRELSEIDRERKRLPNLEERRRDLEDEIEELTAELDDVRETVDEYDADEAGAERTESLLDELDDRRQERTAIRRDIDTQESSLEALREERAELREELDGLSTDDDELDDLDREIDRLRTRKREIEDVISDLSAIVEFNDDFLDADVALADAADGSADPVSALDPDSRAVECWTCGSRVRKGAIADRIDELRGLIRKKREQRERVADDLDEVTARRAEIREAVDREDELERRLDEIDRQITRREERLESLRGERDRLDEEIDDLEARLEGTEDLGDDDLVEGYQRLSDLEYERGQLEERLRETEAEIDEIERRVDDRAGLADRRAELQDEIASLRSRIDDLERGATEGFNEHMADILDLLGYDNLERVWIERKTDGRGTTTFDLHVVRESADGAVYEDTVDTLSESEREVIGLVVALAGYLVHEVYEDVPFVLLDSLEPIDAGRLGDLVDYFAAYAPYLVVALLPEDAEAVDLSVEHTYVTADALGG